LVFGEALRRLRLLLCWKLVFGEALRRLRLLLCVGTYILRRECMACAWIFLLDMELSTVSRLLGFGVQNTGESPVLRGVFRHDKGYVGPGVHGVHLDLHARREALDGGSASQSDRSFPMVSLAQLLLVFVRLLGWPLGLHSTKGLWLVSHSPLPYLFGKSQRLVTLMYVWLAFPPRQVPCGFLASGEHFSTCYQCGDLPALSGADV